MIGCEYSHTKCESLVRIRSSVAKIQHFFLRDCFLLAHPVHWFLKRHANHAIRATCVGKSRIYALRAGGAAK